MDPKPKSSSSPKKVPTLTRRRSSVKEATTTLDKPKDGPVITVVQRKKKASTTKDHHAQETLSSKKTPSKRAKQHGRFRAATVATSASSEQGGDGPTRFGVARPLGNASKKKRDKKRKRRVTETRESSQAGKRRSSSPVERAKGPPVHALVSPRPLAALKTNKQKRRVSIGTTDSFGFDRKGIKKTRVQMDSKEPYNSGRVSIAVVRKNISSFKKRQAKDCKRNPA